MRIAPRRLATASDQKPAAADFVVNRIALLRRALQLGIADQPESFQFITDQDSVHEFNNDR